MANFINQLPWIAIGDFANVGQLVGINAVELISMIVKAAQNARMHKRNCRQFAQHLHMIGNLLEQLDLSTLKRRPECQQPLEQLEQALRNALVLVASCRDKSYLYLVAMGWTYVNKFREYQAEIDKYLNLIPLISLVEKHQERLRAISRDKRLYTMEDSEVKVQESLRKPERTRRDSLRLSKQLSRRYPGVPFELALREENAKLRRELELTRARREVDQCNVIERLIDFTVSAAAGPMILHDAMSQIAEEDEDEVEERGRSKHHRITAEEVRESSNRHVKHSKPSMKYYPPPQKLTYDGAARKDSSNPSSPSQSFRSSYLVDDWHHGLCNCCGEGPCLCIETFSYPCETFTLVASRATDGKTSQDSACHLLACHSLYCGCCCYTCCIRRKVRQRFNIPGDCCGDYWTHVCCCCCAVLQEFHELRHQERQARTIEDPPSGQEMEDYR